MDLSEFDYELPEERIAQQPLEDRAASRMLVVYRKEQRWEDRQFREFPSFVQPGDVIVLNNSKVLPARLFGHRCGARALAIGRNHPKSREYLGGRVEVLLLRATKEDPLVWQVLVRPGRKLQIGERIQFSQRLRAQIVGRGAYGERTVRFEVEGDFFEAVNEVGHVPLPPYIHRPDTAQDQARYQTVYAKNAGSVAAPTAGLHFTPEILAECERAGATLAEVTLHVGLGTFQPLRTQVVEQAKLHAEYYQVDSLTAQRIQSARRVFGIGTTSVRTVETLAANGWRQLEGETELFIYPGYEYRRIDALLTNFHLPQSSLLLLVCAFAGKDLILAAYRHAVRAEYRFYSYGDCMLIL
ncbi:MAG: tRNA preQ1(34) S-adenosylmethionine ribosyltransferase-isomerase QueA [Bryobacteraceae bacterium]|nr:tRNA preQ1(34) S-adenosylmethionine ribosyltransferase-isomerase QueA [Bryobacteraceae bacterium]MDW8377125.1 tRNA preQ1(34) S-adenosylmethionine ribosyltransferase-isomerase QueA [Bryobacterales bacterium]